MACVNLRHARVLKHVSATPTISVLMPSYNVEAYIHEAIESILRQTMGDFEFVIVDDGSNHNKSFLVRVTSMAGSRP